MDLHQTTELLDELAAIPGQVAHAAESHVARTPAEGEWSPNAVVGHLIRVEAEVWQARLKQLSTEENPRWKWWGPEGIDWEGEFGKQSITDLVRRFAAGRSETVDYLRRLSDAEWHRRGTHDVWGVIDVADLCREMLKHDQEHLSQLQANS